MSTSQWSSANSLITKSNYAPTNEQAKLVASDAGSNDYFGWSSAISDDGSYVIVGSVYDDIGQTNQGSAYIFFRTGTTWSQQAKLYISTGGDSDYFGFSVDINSTGDYAIIGAQGDDTNGINQGSAYIFVRSGVSWSQQAKLVPGDSTTQSVFGYSVSINATGTYAVVGACYVDTPLPNQGAAYIYTRSGATWSQEAKLLASDAAAEDYFGWSVSINDTGNYAAISSSNDDVGSNTNQGSVYIFTRSGTTWTQQAKLIASDGGANDYFGCSIALNSSGDYIVIGAYQDDVGSNTEQGSVYIFTRSGTTWTQQAKLIASDGGANCIFGRSVDIDSSGSRVVIGAHNTSSDQTSKGFIYVFNRSGTTWSQDAELVASDGAPNDQFGYSVAISGDGLYIISGARSDNSGRGSAYIFS